MFCNKKRKKEMEELREENDKLRNSLKLPKRIDEKQAKKDFSCVAWVYGGIFIVAIILVFIEYFVTHKTPLSLVILALLATGGLEPFLKGRLMGNINEKYHYTSEEYQMFFERKVYVYKFACIGAIILVYAILIVMKIKGLPC